jgi:hypothetical protein
MSKPTPVQYYYLTLLGGVDGFDQDDGASEGNDCGVILSGFLAS